MSDFGGVPLERKVVAVIGAGAFGTAMATVATRNNHEVRLWARRPEMVDHINTKRRNPDYVPEFDLPDNLTAVKTIEAALDGADVMILCLPVQSVPTWVAENKHLIPPKLLICNTAKGLYLRDKVLLSEAVKVALDGRDQPYAMLSGPSFAKEIMQGMPTAVVVASKYLYHAVTMQRIMSSLIFRAYTSQDLVGVELGGSLKNPLAIGAGLVEGKKLGINTMAAFVTRSSQELQLLCRAMGGDELTISGLSGIGDLMLTSFGALSRNRTCGIRLVQGESMEDICKTSTVEGVPTAEVAVHFADMYVMHRATPLVPTPSPLASHTVPLTLHPATCNLQPATCNLHSCRRCGLELPIFRAIASVLAGKLPIDKVQDHLMGRPLSGERAHESN